MLVIEYHPNVLSDETFTPNWTVQASVSDAGERCFDAVSSGSQTDELALRVSPEGRFLTRLHINKGSALLAIDTPDEHHYFLLPGGSLQIPGLKADFTGTLPSKKPFTPAAHTPQTVTKQAMILAAGFATRLEPIAGEYTGYCKPALPLREDESVILAMARHLVSFGITRLIVNTSFLPHGVKDTLRNLPKGVELFYVDEATPSGTAGGLQKAFELGFVDSEQPMLIVQGDAVSNFDIGALLNTHQEQNASITIGAQTVRAEDVHKFGIIETVPFNPSSASLDPSGNVVCFKEKPSLLEAGDCRFANTGFYVLSPDTFSLFQHVGQLTRQKPLKKTYDFANDFFPAVLHACQNQELAPMIACNLSGYWTDIGNPRQYYQTIREMNSEQASLPDGVILLT
jgi:NDP-sugar pyrophosphorylase family protein